MQISVVVYAFKYPVRTALAVGLSMAQIGEFAFVLLSVASTLGLLPYQVFMLLMGITALSLLVTPFLMQAARHILRDGTDSIAPLPTAWSSKGRVGMSKRAASGESTDPSGDSSSPGSPSPRLDQRHHSLKQSMPAHGSAYPSEVQLQQRYPFL